MTASPQTIAALLETGADAATALSTPGGRPLSYQALRALVREVSQVLHARGIGAGDRVAIVLDNGPEMAAAFLAVGAAATAAPLNPGYRAEEFEFFLSDLHARLVIVASGRDSPVFGVRTFANAFARALFRGFESTRHWSRPTPISRFTAQRLERPELS